LTTAENIVALVYEYFYRSQQEAIHFSLNLVSINGPVTGLLNCLQSLEKGKKKLENPVTSILQKH
jgi:hypothetical protein